MGEPREKPREIRVQTEKRTPEQARRQFEDAILQQGGVSFTPEVGDKVTVLLQPETTIVTTDFNVQGGGKKTKNAELRGELAKSELPGDHLVVTQSTEAVLSNQRYAMDLSDAPPSLQAAVDQAWSNLQRDIRSLQGDLPPELKARKQMLEPVMKLRLAARQEQQPAGETVVVEEFPKGSKAPYDPAQMNRLPASDQAIFASYRLKGWVNLGEKQRAHYRELEALLERPQANAAK